MEKDKYSEQEKIKEIILVTKTDLADPNFTRILLQWDQKSKKPNRKIPLKMKIISVYTIIIETDGDYTISL